MKKIFMLMIFCFIISNNQSVAAATCEQPAQNHASNSVIDLNPRCTNSDWESVANMHRNFALAESVTADFLNGKAAEMNRIARLFAYGSEQFYCFKALFQKIGACTQETPLETIHQISDVLEYTLGILKYEQRKTGSVFDLLIDKPLTDEQYKEKVKNNISKIQAMLRMIN